jgi:hypothetical protein
MASSEAKSLLTALSGLLCADLCICSVTLSMPQFSSIWL